MNKKLTFILSLIDRVSGPITRIQARLHALGVQQAKLFRQNFHSYGDSASGAARKVTLITTAVTAAIAATAALTSAMLPMASMGVAGLGAGIATANAAGVARETSQISQQTGMSQERLQIYRQVGRLEGMGGGFGEMGDMGKIFSEIHGKLQAPDDDFLKMLQELKIPLAEIKGMQPDLVLNRVGLQLERMRISDVKKSQYLEGLAGDASRLLPLLGKNNERLRRMQHHTRAVGAILSPEQIKLMKIASTEMALIKTGVEGYGNKLSDVGGNFMRLFGPEINRWFVDNSAAMQSWVDHQVAELERLHGVFKVGGLRAVYEDLFPNLSAFTQRAGKFIDGFNTSFSAPFMKVVRSTWADVSAVLGTAAGGAEGLGFALGAALFPVFGLIMRMIGDTVIFLEHNWGLVKQIFAWSPLGLIINNWGRISTVLAPVNQAFISLAQYLGILAPGFNAVGTPAGTLMGIIVALTGVLILNKLVFGAVYHVVKLYRGALILLKATTMLVPVATWLMNAAMVATRFIMMALRAMALRTILTMLLWRHSMVISRVAILAMNAALAAGRLVMLGVSAASAALGGGMALLLSPVGLIIMAVAALAVGAYYLYTRWDKVRAYLADTTWGSALLKVFDVIMSPVESFNKAVGWLNKHWQSTTQALGADGWSTSLSDTLLFIISPFEKFEFAIKVLGEVWTRIRDSLANTSWGKPLIDLMDKVAAGFKMVSGAWGKVKGMAGEKVSQGWSAVKSWAGYGDDSPANGGARALGGPVAANHFYEVNERGPELLQSMGRTFLMTGGMNGNIIPFPQQAMNTPTATAPTAGLPVLPDMLALPALPAMPDMPVLPALPAMPDMPVLPALPPTTNNVVNLAEYGEGQRSTSVVNREARPVNPALSALANGEQPHRARQANSANNSKVIKIGEVHIHTNNSIDAHELQAQLEMLA